MKNVLFIALLAFAAVPAIAQYSVPVEIKKSKISTPAGWSDDFENACEKAANEEKDLLVAFSGSDWCSWCILLEEEVFSQKAFTEQISADFVPVYIDLPQDKNRLSPAAQKQNANVVKRYQIKRFPAVLLIDGDGDIIAQTAYVEGGRENYLKHIKKLRAEGRQSPEYKAQKALRKVPQGPERAARLHSILITLPLKLQITSEKYVREVLESDTDDSLGFRKDYPYFTKVLPLENALTNEFNRLGKISEKAIDEHGKPKAKAEYVKIIVDAIRDNSEKLSDIREQARKTAETLPKNSDVANRLNNIINEVDRFFSMYPIDNDKSR